MTIDNRTYIFGVILHRILPENVMEPTMKPYLTKKERKNSIIIETERHSISHYIDVALGATDYALNLMAGEVKCGDAKSKGLMDCKLP